MIRIICSPPMLPEWRSSLIVFAKSAERATGVMTNQRIWMRQKDSPEWVELNVAEIAGFEISAGWASAKAVVAFRDGTRRVYENVEGGPTEAAVALVLRNCNGPPGSIVPASQRDPRPLALSEADGLPCPRCGAWATQPEMSTGDRLQDGAVGGALLGPVMTHLRQSFGAFLCVNCGRIPLGDAPADLQRRVWSRRGLLILAAVFFLASWLHYCCWS